MTTIYKVSYDYQDLATVEIDFPKAESVIKEMVDFWSGSEERLSDANGDYTLAWLRQLGAFIIRSHKVPHGDEGWCDIMSGTNGIRIVNWEAWNFDECEIEVETSDAPAT